MKFKSLMDFSNIAGDIDSNGFKDAIRDAIKDLAGDLDTAFEKIPLEMMEQVGFTHLPPSSQLEIIENLVMGNIFERATDLQNAVSQFGGLDKILDASLFEQANKVFDMFASLQSDTNLVSMIVAKANPEPLLKILGVSTDVADFFGGQSGNYKDELKTAINQIITSNNQFMTNLRIQELVPLPSILADADKVDSYVKKTWGSVLDATPPEVFGIIEQVLPVSMINQAREKLEYVSKKFQSDDLWNAGFTIPSLSDVAKKKRSTQKRNYNVSYQNNLTEAAMAIEINIAWLSKLKDLIDKVGGVIPLELGTSFGFGVDTEVKVHGGSAAVVNAALGLGLGPAIKAEVGTVGLSITNLVFLVPWTAITLLEVAHEIALSAINYNRETPAGVMEELEAMNDTLESIKALVTPEESTKK